MWDKMPMPVTTFGTYTLPLAQLADSNALKIVGRTATNEEGTVFEWTASGFVMRGELEGTVSAVIRMKEDQAGCRLRVWVDGADAGEVVMEAGVRSYALVQSLARGEHTLRVAKVNDPTFSAITLSDLTFTGLLRPVPEAQRRIEFFGDSITSGLDLHLDREDFAARQDGTRTYAALTADALEAEYHVMSLGGWGCIGGVAGQWENIPSLLERASFRACSEAMWSFDRWQPQVVVVNLGTNDGGYMYQHNKSEQELEECVGAYLTAIRAKYPEAHIIWAYGMMGNGLQGALLRVIDRLREVDPRMHYLELPFTVRGEGYHPGYEDSVASSEVLIPFIKQVTGWGDKRPRKGAC